MGGGVINPYLVSCAFYMLSFEKYAGRYNSCRKHGWGGHSDSFGFHWFTICITSFPTLCNVNYDYQSYLLRLFTVHKYGDFRAMASYGVLSFVCGELHFVSLLHLLQRSFFPKKLSDLVISHIEGAL